MRIDDLKKKEKEKKKKKKRGRKNVIITLDRLNCKHKIDIF